MISLFWISLAALLYIYFGYPLLVWLLAGMFGREAMRQPVTPSVSFVIPAYNEERHIEAKLRNTLTLDYPREQLEIVVASDGCTDHTDEIVKRFESQGVKLFTVSKNLGKSLMLSRTVPQLHGELVVFSDASSQVEPDALRKIAQPFADPKVGCVCGLYRLKGGDNVRAEGEGLYWKYETFIKRQESRLHSILGAHGAFYAIRRHLFNRLEATAINDDYLIPMRIVGQGYRAVYEPSAVAWELESSSAQGEFARRLRIAAGNCQQVIELRGMLNPLRGWVAFSFFSHKLLRTIAPVFMVSLFLTTFWLQPPLNWLLLALQTLFYASAFAGYLCYRSGRLEKWLSPPFYFCFGNLAMLIGLIRFCAGKQRPEWGR